MDSYRFYCSCLSESFAELDPVESHHLADVLRLKRGDKVELFDGQGTLANASVMSVSGKVTLQVKEKKLSKPDRPKIVIAASIAKGGRFNWLISKCTELGIDHICPILFERTVKLSKNPKAVQRWQKLAISAAKQSRRLFLPKIDKPSPLPKAIEQLKYDYPDARILFGCLSEDAPALIAEPFGQRNVISFIGPEGGLTEAEQIRLQNQGGTPVRLAETVLRIETAVLSFAAILTAQRDS